MWLLCWMVSIHSWICLWHCWLIVSHLTIWKANQINGTPFTKKKTGFIHSDERKCLDVISRPALAIFKHGHSAWTWFIQILNWSEFTVWSKISNDGTTIALASPKHKFSLEHSWEWPHAAIFYSPSFVPSFTKVLLLPFSIACGLPSATAINGTFGTISDGGLIIVDNWVIDVGIDCGCFGAIFFNEFLIDFSIGSPSTISTTNLNIILKTRKT